MKKKTMWCTQSNLLKTTRQRFKRLKRNVQSLGDYSVVSVSISMNNDKQIKIGVVKGKLGKNLKGRETTLMGKLLRVTGQKDVF